MDEENNGGQAATTMGGGDENDFDQMEREHAANAVAREFLGLYDEDCQFAHN